MARRLNLTFTLIKLQVLQLQTIMTWQPQAEGLQQILEVLRHANSPDNRIHQMVQQVNLE
jgi:hypothetical protein